LLRSRFAIVILSPNYFDKGWTKRELGALFSLSTHRRVNNIIPVWYSISTSDMAEWSPLLTDAFALRWETGLEAVVQGILSVVSTRTDRSDEQGRIPRAAERQPARLKERAAEHSERRNRPDTHDGTVIPEEKVRRWSPSFWQVLGILAILPGVAMGVIGILGRKPVLAVAAFTVAALSALAIVPLRGMLRLAASAILILGAGLALVFLMIGPTVTVIAQVYIDRNGNGIRDGSETAEPGPPDLPLVLEDSTGRTGRVYTDQNGRAKFARVPPGIYAIKLPDGRLVPGRANLLNTYIEIGLDAESASIPDPRHRIQVARATATLEFTSVPVSTSTLAPTVPPTPYVEVIAEGIDMRTGPGVCYDALGFAQVKDRYVLRGQSPEKEPWWQVEYEDGFGWVFSRLTKVSQEAADVPVVSTIPTPPEPRDYILCLMEAERQAALAGDINLIRMIYAPDAVRRDGMVDTEQNAIASYQTDFDKLTHLEIVHKNTDIAILGSRAVVTNDTRGRLLDESGNTVTYDSLMGDEWIFKSDTTGRWWLVEMTYSLMPAWITYEFEDGTEGFWAERHYDNQPQGSAPTYTAQASYRGDGSLQFSFDLPGNQTHCGQVVRYSVPFGGQASAHVYAPVGAPADLQAGLFAQDYDKDPYNPHPATNMVRLSPGKWTRVDWNLDVSSWAYPQHFVGIQICQAGPPSYKGYVLIDDVSFSTSRR
jgi:hypothetical protein